MAIRLIFIVNPAARGCPGDIGRRIEASYPDAVVLTTEKPGDATRLARKALTLVRTDEDTVIACGGDGTVREVAGAVGHEATLGILPLGTVNQVAGQLGIPANLKSALKVLGSGVTSKVYPGRCTFDGIDEPHLFFIGVSAGPDADAVRLVHPGLKKALGGLAYGAAFIQRLLCPVADNVLCLVEKPDGSIEKYRASEAIALAGDLYAGRFRFSGSASLTIPGLVLAHVRGGRLKVLSFFVKALLASPPRNDFPHMAEASLTLELPTPGTFQIDGDPFTAKMAAVTPWTRPLIFRVPAS